MTSLQPILRRFAIVLLAPLWLGATLFALFVLVHAATWTGRAAALALGLIVTNLFVVVVWGLPRRFHSRRRRLAWNVASCLGLLFCVPLPVRAPRGFGGDKDLEVAHVFLKPETRFRRFILSNMMPEIDQIATGIGLARWIDPFVDDAQAARVRDLCLELERRRAGDRAFADTGSVLGLAYAEVRGQKFDAGHYLAIVPRSEPCAGKPVLVFLHGSGGNFSLYWEALAPLAREHGLPVLCPSFGFGLWGRPEGLAQIDRVVQDASTRYGVDSARVVLVALSSGGTGVTRAVKERAGRFRGVVMISAVLEQEPIRQGVVAGAWKDLPVLVIHGSQDRRIPLANIERRMHELERGGARLSRLILPAQDHFLFFAERDAVIERIAGFVLSLPAQRKGPPGG